MYDSRPTVNKEFDFRILWTQPTLIFSLPAANILRPHT